MSFDDTLGFGKVVSSSVEGEHSFTLYNVAGISALDFTINDTDQGGEVGISEEVYQALGIVGRPKPPSGTDSLEVIFARTGDGLVPFGYRDARLHRFFPNPGEGDLAFVSYGGGFHSMSLNAAGETIHTLYVPFEFDSEGVAQKAHAVVMDPNPANGITVTHADGYQVALTEDGILMRTPDANTFLQIKEGEIKLQATKILVKGNVYVGASAETGVPLLAGPASPPCPSLFVSPM